MKRFLSLVLIIILSFSVFAIPASSDVDDNEVAIVFTHDLHSHIDSFKLDGNDVGGFARIKSLIDDTKSNNKNVFVFDAGDFSMGTLFQTIFESDGAEYQMLGALGYDAITFGNHEFDYGFDSVKKMITSAKANTSSLPPILCANIDITASGLSEKELNDLNIQEYTLINKNGLDVAVFGLLGKDATQLSSSSNLTFKDYIQAAQDTVAEIKNLYSPDLIICLSHSGTGSTVNDEDVELAKSVDGIDLIISGHTHTKLSEPIIVNNTVIGSCGEYGEYVGRLVLNLDNDVANVKSYELLKADTKVPFDNDINIKVEEFKSKIGDYLHRFGYSSADEVLAYAPFDFPEQSSMGDGLSEQQLGNLISDSYIHAIKEAEGENYTTVDVAVAPLGVIRSSIDKGEVTVAQAFEISSLGIGNDGIAGYPLCSVYLYGSELWSLAEVDASVSGLMSYAQLYCSGLNYSVNTNRMFLNRVYDCWLVDENGKRIEIENDKLYRVVSGMSSAIMLGMVKDKSFGLLELTPKDKDGNPITDFNKHIALDRNGAEVKEWKALADYLASFPKNEDELPTIPLTYASYNGRKNINNSFSLTQIFVNWNMFSWILFTFIIVLIAIITLIVLFVVKKVRKKRKYALSQTEISEQEG